MAKAADSASQDATREAGSTSPDWILTIGATGEIGPRYFGSDRTGFSAMPSFGFRRADEPAAFSAPDDGFDFTLFSSGRFEVGPVASVRTGRYRSADARLSGLPDVPWTVDAGIYVEYWPIQDRLRTRMEIRQGLRLSDGLVADLSADWVQRFGRLTLSGGPRLSLGNAAFMSANFGVTPNESAVNGLIAPYSAHAGPSSAGVLLAETYDWSKSWSTTLYERYDRLLGDAAKSTIVSMIGTKNQYTLGLSLNYSFPLGL